MALSVLILGIGNTLMQDDGIGVWAVQALLETYVLPPNVRVVEGGVAGFRLLPEIDEAEHLLIIDAVKGNCPPGTVYHLAPEDLPASRTLTLSAHEVGIMEVLSVAELIGKMPHTKILGVQPLETERVGLELTQPLKEAIPFVVAAAAEELRALGIVMFRKKERGHA